MKKSKNNIIILVLVFGFMYLVSVDAKDRSKMDQIKKQMQIIILDDK